MSRRSSPGLQVVAVVVVVIAFLYGFYCYHHQHTRLKRSEETVDKLTQKTESLSAQLQVLYEHKTRLETNVQQEKEISKKYKEDAETQRRELENQLTQTNGDNSALKRDAENMKLKLAEMESTVSRVQTEYTQLTEETEKTRTELRDEISNLHQQLNECRSVRQPNPNVVQHASDHRMVPTGPVNAVDRHAEQPDKMVVDRPAVNGDMQQIVEKQDNIRESRRDARNQIVGNEERMQHVDINNEVKQVKDAAADGDDDDEYADDIQKPQHAENIDGIRRNGAGL